MSHVAIHPTGSGDRARFLLTLRCLLHALLAFGVGGSLSRSRDLSGPWDGLQ